MMGRGEWRLIRGGELLAVFHRCDDWRFADYPCAEAEYEPTAAFEPLRSLFDRESKLLDLDDERSNEEWADIWEEIQRPGLFVESADGREKVEALWVHFSAGRAWWMPLYNSPRTVLATDGTV